MPKICRFFLLFTFYFLLCRSFAQQNTAHLRISVLTCAPGDELYSSFGHSALRIIDSVQHTDIVYNWGTFDISVPNFYMKFARGKLLYFLSTAYFNDFIVEYQEGRRNVYEQVLNLSSVENAAIYNAIQQNLLDSKRFYHYDFLYDNCTTRIRDILSKYTSEFKVHGAIVPQHTTYRDLLHNYLDKGGEPWNKLGIDILLGSEADAELDTKSAMFLPEYLMKGIDSASSNEKALVLQRDKANEGDAAADTSNKNEPLVFFSILAAVLVLLSFVKPGWARQTVRIFDSLLLYVTGLLGFLILFLWLFSDYTAYHNNYNLLWALPTNFVAAFFIWKRPQWIRKYFWAASLLYILLLLFWAGLPQQFNISLIPVFLLLSYRCYRLSAN
jgi:hypothetical protein